MTKGVQHSPTPLVLGGHSFISELGSDPAVGDEAHAWLVGACLDAGIRGIDTTYQPEREALGRVLEQLERRDDAEIFAWNFFTDPDSGEYLVGPKPYEAHHLDEMLQQLRTDKIDHLVVHSIGNEARDREQIELAASWKEAGRVGELGTWAPGPNPEQRYGADNPFAFAVNPCNVGSPDEDVFRAAQEIGWRTYATSPFNRGWLLDEYLERALRLDGGDRDETRAKLADVMLRFSLFTPDVDCVIIGIRKMMWIEQNLISIARGPLGDEEEDWLRRLKKELPSAAEK